MSLDHNTNPITRSEGRTTVDLDVLTPADYARLPRYVQANIPDTVRTRLAAHIEVDFLEARQARRSAELAEIGPRDLAAEAVLRKRLTPPVPIENLDRSERGQFLDRNPSEPCPNARYLGLRGADNTLTTTSVHCKLKSCPVCGPHWAALHLEGIGYRIDDTTGARFEAYTITPDLAGRWKTAVKRARARGVAINGVSIPTHLDGTVIVLLARTCNAQICRSITPHDVADPVAWVDLALQAAIGAARQHNDIPPEHRPRKLSPIRGLGTWRGRLLPYLGEEPESTHTVAYEFLDLPDQATLITMARDAGMTSRKLPNGSLELRERRPGAEQALIAQLQVIETREEPNWHSPF